MKDKDFKSLIHTPVNYNIYNKGGEVEPGYKPDYVLKKENEYIILESENCSSRKTFVGGLIKAAHFLQGEKSGVLIFVIVPKENTKTSSIANHLKQYFNWIQSLTNLKEVYVIDSLDYYSNGVVNKFNSKAFISKALKIHN